MKELNDLNFYIINDNYIMIFEKLSVLIDSKKYQKLLSIYEP